MAIPHEYRDPWVMGGLALLLLLSLGVVMLYRGAPQSVEEARIRGWVAARPDAYNPNLRRAEERLRTAAAARELGNDSVADVSFASAAQHAWAAREGAPDEAGSAAATELWAEAMLQRAQLLHHLGTGRGLRRDHAPTLREGLALAEQVLVVPTSAETRARAEEVRQEIERRLRWGPLEWLPPRR